MKKVIFLSALVLCGTLGMISCKKKKNDSDPAPSEEQTSDYCVKRTYQDSSDNYTNGATELFKFRGGKLIYYNSDIHRSGYISSREQVEYSYNGEGLLATMVVYSNNGQSKEYVSYQYEGGKIKGYTTSQTGLGGNEDSYPNGRYYYDENGRINCFVEEFSSTQKDSIRMTVNADGKITYKKTYQNGVLYQEQTNMVFDANGNEIETRYKRYNSLGDVTLETKHVDVYSATKNPVFGDTWQNFYNGNRPIYNDNYYMSSSEDYINLTTDELEGKTRLTLTFDDQNRLSRSRRETYNFGTSAWEFQYDYEYSYTCD